MTATPDGTGPVQFTIVRERGHIVDVVTDSTGLNHFLRVLRLSRSYHTWVNYAHDPVLRSMRIFRRGPHDNIVQRVSKQRGRSRAERIRQKPAVGRR